MSHTTLLLFQPDAMSPTHLAAVSYLARYSSRTHILYAFQLRRWFGWWEATGSILWSGSNVPTSSSRNPAPGRLRFDGLVGQHLDARRSRVLPVCLHRRPHSQRPCRLRPAAQDRVRRVPHQGLGPARADRSLRSPRLSGQSQGSLPDWSCCSPLRRFSWSGSGRQDLCRGGLLGGAVQAGMSAMYLLLLHKRVTYCQRPRRPSVTLVSHSGRRATCRQRTPGGQTPALDLGLGRQHHPPKLRHRPSGHHPPRRPGRHRHQVAHRYPRGHRRGPAAQQAKSRAEALAQTVLTRERGDATDREGILCRSPPLSCCGEPQQHTIPDGRPTRWHRLHHRSIPQTLASHPRQ